MALSKAPVSRFLHLQKIRNRVRPGKCTPDRTTRGLHLDKELVCQIVCRVNDCVIGIQQRKLSDRPVVKIRSFSI